MVYWIQRDMCDDTRVLPWATDMARNPHQPLTVHFMPASRFLARPSERIVAETASCATMLMEVMPWS